MPRRKVWLVLAVVLFVVWMGYLIHLAVTHRRPIVLSRPQILVSQLDILAHFDTDDELKTPTVKVTKVLFKSKDLKDYQVPDQIQVTNLAQCAGYWSGPGDYLLPLQREQDDTFVISSIPRSPGFPAPGENTRPVIYRWTPEIEDQFNHVPKPAAVSDP